MKVLIASLAAAFLLVGCFEDKAKAPTVATAPSPPDSALPVPPLSVEWDDADSGRINGRRFRINSIDAPETGGVGAAIGAALCEPERQKGLVAKAWADALTKDAAIVVAREYGLDRMPEPRLLVDLTVNGQDYGAAGIAAGHLRAWPHEGTKPLAPKPDWCR